MTPGFQSDELRGRSPDIGDAGAGSGFVGCRALGSGNAEFEVRVSKGRDPRGSILCGGFKATRGQV